MKYEFTKEQEYQVSEYMWRLGIPAHLKGYHFTRVAVLIVMQDMETVTSVTKLLYPEVAKICNSAGSKVERAIRNAIEVVWNRNPEYFKEFFRQPTWESRPTNSEFIAQFVEIIKYSN